MHHLGHYYRIFAGQSPVSNGQSVPSRATSSTELQDHPSLPGQSFIAVVAGCLHCPCCEQAQGIQNRDVPRVCPLRWWEESLSLSVGHCTRGEQPPSLFLLIPQKALPPIYKTHFFTMPEAAHQTPHASPCHWRVNRFAKGRGEDAALKRRHPHQKS